MEPDRVGQKLGNYLLLNTLGTGGFATVYLGEHIYLKQPAAIKVLKTLPQTDQARDHFLKEARTIARLTHPNIIHVIECGVDVGASHSTPYIVMTYISEGNVRNKYPQGTLLPLEDILSFANQAAEALQYAHDQGTVHCDVKPENMLIGGPDQILLADFGIANISHTAHVNAVQMNSTDSDPNLSDDNIQGTVTYMAPERFDGLIRRASDQYSLAVVVYEWLAGDPPFTGSRDKIIYQHMKVPPPTLSTRNPQITPEIEQVVLNALEKEPDQRYASIKEFAMALEEAILASPWYTPTPTIIESLAIDTLASLPTAADLPDPDLPPTKAAPIAETPKEPTIAASFLTEAEQPAPSASIVSQSDYAETVLPDDQFSPPVQPPSDQVEDSIEDSINVQPPASASSSIPMQTLTPSPPTTVDSFTPEPTLVQVPSTSTPPSASMPHFASITPSASVPMSIQDPNSALNPIQQIYNTVGIVAPLPNPPQQQHATAGLNYSPGGSQTLGSNRASQQTYTAGGASRVSQEEESIGFFSHLGAALGSIVALEPEFATQPESRGFRRLGWLANGLCAILCGLVAQSWTVFLVGLLALGAFWLCIRLVKWFMALTFGLAIAAYWGWFGFFLANWLVAINHLLFSTLPPAEIIAGAFFIISAIMHINYIVRRLA